MHCRATLSEQEFDIPAPPTDAETLVYLEEVVGTRLHRKFVPILYVLPTSAV